MDKIKDIMISDRFKEIIRKFNDEHSYLKKSIDMFTDLHEGLYVISVVCETDRDLKDEYYFNFLGHIKLSFGFNDEEFYNLFEKLLNELLDNIKTYMYKAKYEYGFDLSTREGRKELFSIKSESKEIACS